MSKVLAKRRTVDAILGIALLISMAALIIYPAEASAAAKEGLVLCYNVIIPSLFPFFVLSSLVVEFGLARYIGRALEKIMRPLFNVGGACSVAFSLGLIGGYPVGARTAITLYEKGISTKTETERLLSFCNNSGPAFILGVVGAGIFSSSKIGLLLYLIHIVASVLVGFIFRFYKHQEKASSVKSQYAEIESVRLSAAFSETIKSSFMSVISICAFVVFFTVFIRLLIISGIMARAAGLLATLLKPFGMNTQWATRLITGLIEISSGVNTLSGISDALSARVGMAAFMLGWAGFSVHCQVMSFIGRSGLSVKTYLIGKILHGIISTFLALIVCRMFLGDVPVSSFLAEQIANIGSVDFSTALRVSAAVSWAVWVAAVLLATHIYEKSSSRKKQR